MHSIGTSPMHPPHLLSREVSEDSPIVERKKASINIRLSVGPPITEEYEQDDGQYLNKGLKPKLSGVKINTSKKKKNNATRIASLENTASIPNSSRANGNDSSSVIQMISSREI